MNFKDMSPEEKAALVQAAMNDATGGADLNDPMQQSGPARSVRPNWNMNITPAKPDPERSANAQIERAASGADLQQLGGELDRSLAPKGPPASSLYDQLNGGEIPLENAEAPSEDEQSRASRLQWLQQKRLQGN